MHLLQNVKKYLFSFYRYMDPLILINPDPKVKHVNFQKVFMHKFKVYKISSEPVITYRTDPIRSTTRF